jgi:hydroxymethylbilane synthase
LKTIKLISRKSDLAKIQAHLVSTELKNKFPDLEVELIFKSTLGDNDLTTPLNKMPDIGVFTSDIKKDLLSGRGDLAVHSWKDLPIDTEPGTFICGTLQRADMRDMLFLKKSSKNKTFLEILSSSPRREKNLSNFLPHALPGEPNGISFHDVRGNIQTRFTKLMKGDRDGLVVAKAAIDRILKSQKDEFKVGRELLREALKSLNWMVLPLSVNPCAAAQGALALEIRTEDNELRSMIESISDVPAFKLIEEERLILKSYGGGCHQKIGASIESFEIGQVKTVKGETEDGEEIDERVFKPKKEVKYRGANIF